MNPDLKRLRTPIIALMIFGLIAFPLATGAAFPLQAASAVSPALQISYEPDIPALEFVTEEPDFIATAVDAGEIGDLAGEGLPSYQRAACGSIDDDICYEICYLGECFIYGDDDDRVKRYKDKVDEVKEGFAKLELARIGTGETIWETVGTCLKSIGAGMGVGGVIAGIVVVADPTGIIKGLAVGGAILSVLGGGAICGGAVVGAGADKVAEEQIVDEIRIANEDAVFEFNDLKQDPPG